MVLEYQPGAPEPSIGSGLVRAVVDDLQAWQPAALVASDRYALQLHVAARGPAEALRQALELHDGAVSHLQGRRPTMARVEVLTAREFESQWEQPLLATPAQTSGGQVLSNELYWSTRALLRATTAAELSDVVTGFVTAVGGQIHREAPRALPGQVVFDLSLPDGGAAFAVVERVSVAAMILETCLATLVADARAAGAQRRGTRVERMFVITCLDCPIEVSFAERPGEARCPGCGVHLYLTHDGLLGRYVADDWRPGGIQGYR